MYEGIEELTDSSISFAPGISSRFRDEKAVRRLLDKPWALRKGRISFRVSPALYPLRLTTSA
jgi:hypothetical protein